MNQAALRRITVNQLSLGMHLHALDGPWIRHPFWRSRFTVTDPADIQALLSSGITHCWIDPEQGLDVVERVAPGPAASCAGAAAPEAGMAAPAPAPAPVAAGAASAARPREQASMASELQRAALVVERSRGAVQAMFREARLGKTVDAAGFQPLVDDITASVMRNPGALISLARLKTQDDYSYMHSVAVCALMVALAHEYGFEEGACRQAGLAGLMHDIGKVTIPVEVLTKPGRLSPEEWLVVRAHPEAGHAMLLEARGAGPAVLDVCLHHHEKMDGSGYPQRLSGEEISLLARMGAVCDVYDAITSDRAYKAGWEPAHAIAQMSSWKGHFDPAVFALFVKCVGIYPVGSLVRLASGRLAVVTEHHTASVLAPKVRVFFSTKSNMPIPTEEIDLSRPGASDRIVARESRSKWGFDHLESLWGVSSVGR